jgi:hypothetical protein
MALDSPTLAAHLGGIETITTMPLPPVPSPAAVRDASPATPDLAGVWTTAWMSIKMNRPHRGDLVIPANHGRSFTAPMVVTYERAGQQSIVRETMNGTLADNSLTLTGVSYSYVERGASAVYSLDNFELKVEDAGKTLVGRAILRHGTREVSFVRVEGPAV